MKSSRIRWRIFNYQTKVRDQLQTVGVKAGINTHQTSAIPDHWIDPFRHLEDLIESAVPRHNQTSVAQSTHQLQPAVDRNIVWRWRPAAFQRLRYADMAIIRQHPSGMDRGFSGGVLSLQEHPIDQIIKENHERNN
jgi:hypothetical protein